MLTNFLPVQDHAFAVREPFADGKRKSYRRCFGQYWFAGGGNQAGAQFQPLAQFLRSVLDELSLQCDHHVWRMANGAAVKQVLLSRVGQNDGARIAAAVQARLTHHGQVRLAGGNGATWADAPTVSAHGGFGLCARRAVDEVQIAAFTHSQYAAIADSIGPGAGHVIAPSEGITNIVDAPVRSVARAAAEETT